MNNVTRVVLIDNVRAGLIGARYTVAVIRDGRMIASTSGIQTRERAEQVRAQYEAAYGSRRAA